MRLQKLQVKHGTSDKIMVKTPINFINILIIGLEVIKKYKVSTKYSHLDSTSFHLHGQYNNRDRDETEQQRALLGLW